MKRKMIKICYLCGKPLKGEISNDHVPPKQIYGTGVRRDHRLNLLTIPTHKKCNRIYQEDEDYFVHSLAPLARGSYSGESVLSDVLGRYKDGKNIGLLHKVRKEFDKNPSGLILPKGKILKRLEGNRIYRIAWKIIRGLYFHSEGKYLPESTPRRLLQITGPTERPSEYIMIVKDINSLGAYPGVFDYKYVCLEEVDKMYYWAMLFWDKIIMTFIFHNPDCKCDKCLDI